MNTRNFSIVLILISLFTGFSLGIAEAKPEFKLTYSNFFPPTHANAVLGQEFCKEIEKQTQGRVKITYYPGGTITKAPNVYDGVLNGLTDIGMSNLAYTRGRFPEMEALDLPFGYPSGWVSTQMANDFYRKFKPKEFDKVHVLYFYASGPNIIYTTKTPIYALGDLKGLSIRGTGRIADTVNALGGTAVPTAMPEVYEALSKGVISGVMGPMEMLKGWRTADVTKYAANCWKIGNVYTFYVVMNKRKWDRFPADIKQIFQKVCNQWIEKHAVTSNEIDKIGKAYFQKKGGTITQIAETELPEWQARVKPVITQYMDEMKSKGFNVNANVEYIQNQIPVWIQKQKQMGIISPYTEGTE